jgi:hypothetical protein
VDDLDIAGSVDLESVGRLGELVGGGKAEGLDGLGLDRGGVDGRAVTALGFEEEEIGQETLAAGV